MKKQILLLSIVLGSLLFSSSCSFLSEEPPKPQRETFLTLADISGRTTLREDSPGVRIILVKSKAYIKRNDLLSAKRKAEEMAALQAVDIMVRELLPTDNYNKNYANIEEYMSKNIENYIEDREIVGEKKIFGDKYYGISVAFKVSRQKTLVALQKDLKLINTSASTIITVITNKKDLDLSSAGGLTITDIESALMNQIQTDFNQRGLRAMDHRNAIISLQTDEKKKAAFAKLSKIQFMAMISGSSAGDAALNTQIKNSEEFYSTGLTLLKQLAKVVVEVNIFAISNVNGNISLSLNVTGKNISTGTGGAFANTVVNVARQGGSNTIPAAMITALVKDAYQDMSQEFIPQVIKEMSTISVGGKKLIAYDLVLKDFNSKESRGIRKNIENLESDEFRYIDRDNSVPTILTIKVRYAGKVTKLSDTIMDVFDDINILVEEPIVAPNLTDVVFVKELNPEG